MKTTLAILAPLFVSAFAFAAPEAKVAMKLSPAGSFSATTKTINGTAKKNKDGSVEASKIEIPLDALDTGIALRNEHMKTKHLETAKFPNAIVTDAKGKDGKGTATLEVHGVKKPITGTYAIDGNELVVNFPINVADFNVGKIRYMGVGVKEEATVEARIPIK
ncbi:MAG: YceI family protein [Bdellovibrionota bacterium]